MSNVFEGAIDVIKDRGWMAANGAQPMNQPDSRVCILGAVAEAKGMGAYNWSILIDGVHGESLEHVILRMIIAEQYPDYECFWESATSYVYSWNDCEAETQDNVIAVLEKAASRVADE
jgi:hypothetical protein